MKTRSPHSRTRRVSGAIGALVVALVSTLAVAGPAAAAPADIPTGNGSLTIHKYEQPNPEGDANNTGEQLGSIPASWNALENVNFTYQRIDVDLTDSAGWTQVAGYAADPASAPLTGAATTVSTGADGAAVVGSLPVGAYLVTEVDSPNALRGGELITITQRAAPFVVTIPIPTGEGTWNSHVHVYPKNSVTTVNKVPGTPASPGIGSVIPWTITVQVPQLPSGQVYGDFRVTDTLDSKLAYAETTAVTLDGNTIGSTTNVTGQQIEWVVSDLAALNAAQGKDLVITFTTTVLRTGAIENTADVWINDPGKTGTPITTPAATTYWGAVNILKYAAECAEAGPVPAAECEPDRTKTLAGAQFAVYTDSAQAAAGAEAGRVAVTRDASGATIPAQTVFTTGTDGTVLIPGLFAGNSTDTAPISRTYYLREITAPAGYQLNTAPIAVTVAADGVATPVQVDVPNVQLPPITLPLTGGDGTLLLTVAGGALLVAAIGIALFAARRRTERS